MRVMQNLAPQFTVVRHSTNLAASLHPHLNGCIYASPPGYQSGRNTPNGGYGFSQLPVIDENQMNQPLSRPPTNYLDVAIPTTRSDAAGEYGAPGPSDAEIDRVVQALLRDTNLNSVTKREIRRELEE